MLTNLATSMAGGTLLPSFGEIYHGNLVGQEFSFGAGAPHYAMVRGFTDMRPAQPLIPFAPITSKKNSGRGVLKLPVGTLPPKEGHGHVVSYVILFFPAIRISESAVRSRFQMKTRLNDDLKKRARQIIEELNNARRR